MAYSEKVLNYRSFLRERLDFNPNEVKTLISLGALEFECFHEHEKAIILLEKALTIEPKNADAMFWLAMCHYYDYCEYEKAEKLLRTAIENDANRPDCLSLLAWVLKDSKKPLEEAVVYVEKAISLAPDWPMLRVQLATLFLKMGKINEADQEMQKAFHFKELSPEKVTNEVERYYEDVVTGRTWDKEELRASDIAQLIRKAKMESK